jgi:hypothetical protein
MTTKRKRGNAMTRVALDLRGLPSDDGRDAIRRLRRPVVALEGVLEVLDSHDPRSLLDRLWALHGDESAGPFA